ncbi:MAG TPA: hypothetical protein VGC78_03065 [Gaiellaceae bacterium]|jgi:hypothetical protein
MALISGIGDVLWGSPRRQRRSLVLSGGVFALGLALFLALVVFRGTSNAFPDHFSNQPATLIHKDKPAKVTAAQFALARRFLKTAVARKDLDAAYALVDPDLRGNLTRAQWHTGNIPVLFYRAANIATASFGVDYSYRTQALFEVNLRAAPGTETRPEMLFFVGLKRAGGKPNGAWRVNYFEPNWRPPVPVGPAR